VRTDLRLNEISPQAKELFGVDNQKEAHELVEIRERLRERMDEVQFRAYLREQAEMLARIQAEGMGLASEEQSASALPVARVPIVFRNTSGQEGLQPTGYLPVLDEYSCDRGLIKLRMLFVPVSESMSKDPAGHWVCEV